MTLRHLRTDIREMEAALLTRCDSQYMQDDEYEQSIALLNKMRFRLEKMEAELDDG